MENTPLIFTENDSKKSKRGAENEAGITLYYHITTEWGFISPEISVKFFIISDPNLTQTQTLVLKLIPNLTQTLIFDL